ncbi:MAG: hypothetical protein KAT43_03090 [Nanoarchaeota archaeon]|nr:hypothetical protein [Nanoarchaeota archaeon]
MGLYKLLIRYDNRLDRASKTIEAQSDILEGSAHRKNGAARKEMLDALKTIDQTFEGAWRDVKPALEERFSPEWREKIETEAWITYLMHRRNIFNMDYESPVTLDGRLARKLGFYPKTFNCKYRFMLNFFVKEVQSDFQALQKEGVTVNPDDHIIRKITNKRLAEFLFRELDKAISKGKIEPYEMNKATLIREFPFGVSQFHIFADRINYLIRDLRDSENPKDKEQYIDQLKNLREKEIRGYEAKVLREARKVEVNKPSLGGRPTALRRMLFLLEECAVLINDDYAQNARGDPNDRFEELVLFNPDRQFYENAIDEMINDMDPFQIKELPGPKTLTTLLTNISETIELAAQKAQLSPSRLYTHYERFLRQSERLLKEVLEATRIKIMEAAEACKDKTVDELLENNKILYEKWGEYFPDVNVKLDLTKDIDQRYRENIVGHLDGFRDDMQRRFQDLDFRNIPGLIDIYKNEYDRFILYVPEDFKPADIEEIAKSEAKRHKIDVPKIIEKRDELYTQVENALQQEDLSRMMAYAEWYAALCKTFPEECGPAKFEEIQTQIYEKAQDARKDAPEKFPEYAGAYLKFSSQYFDSPDQEQMKNLGIQQVTGQPIRKLRVVRIVKKKPEEKPDSE